MKNCILGKSAAALLMGNVAPANAKDVSISFILTNDIDQMTGDGLRWGPDRALGLVAQERAAAMHMLEKKVSELRLASATSCSTRRIAVPDGRMTGNMS